MTLARPSRVLSGIGLHLGQPGSVQVFPSDRPAQGILFRSDRDQSEIPARIENLSGTGRCTELASGAALKTVEHLLSALAGLGVTDATIVYDGPEVPALDGSAIPFAEAVADAGVCQEGRSIAPLALESPVVVSGEGAERLVFVPADRFWASVVLDYPDRPALGATAATYYGGDPSAYMRDVAPARTYGFLSELERLVASGLARGASLENAVALRDDGSPDERTPLRFPNEMARHKLLDLIGDLSLVGRPLLCGILAVRPSHAVNARGAAMLAQMGIE